MSKFKQGDRVYCPQFGTGVYTVYPDAYCNSPLVVRTPTGSFLGIDEDGKHNEHDVLPSVFHVTPENKELLDRLYNVEFEQPKRILKGSELCKHLLKAKPHVFCRVSNLSDEATLMANAPIRCIVACRSEVGFTFEVDGSSGLVFNYAVPIDTETLQPLEMEVDYE